MPEIASISDKVDAETEEKAVAKARAEIAAGKGIPQKEVIKWLRSWGTSDELPAPVPKPR